MKTEPEILMPEPKKRTRTLNPLNAESMEGANTRNEHPADKQASPDSEPIGGAPIGKPIPIQFEDAIPALHSVIQAIAGPNRGVLAQIGEIHGPIYKCYLVLPNNRRDSFEIKAADCIIIGKPRIAARNPFAVTQVPQPGAVHPVAQPSFDDPTSEI